jgi:hypothetical protein
MTETVANYPLRVSASSISGLLGIDPSTRSSYILTKLRNQLHPKPDNIVVERPSKNKLVDNDVYWTLVGMIKDNYSLTREKHIEAIKEYIGEKHTETWYSKLYQCICSTIGYVVHERLIDEPIVEALTFQLTPTVLLVGKPDIIEDDRVIEIKNRKTFFDVIPEKEKVQLTCYLKLTNKTLGILREVVGTETKDTIIELDEEYWKKIERTVLAFLEWV